MNAVRFAPIRTVAMGVAAVLLTSIIIFSPTPALATECTISGTSGDDTLQGTEDNDFICGGDGNDVINGLGGDDTILGGAGNDTISGGEGVDTIFGGAGNDTIAGDEGNDIISGGGRWNGLVASGNDALFELGGNDTVLIADGNDSIAGGDGDDTIRGDQGDDTILGGDGNDKIAGENGADRVSGGDGDDSITGGHDSDRLSGDAGDDTITGGDAADYLDGGDGNDTLSGGKDDDSLLGGNGDDSLAGEDGNDILAASAGDDTIVGGAGADILMGGPGTDILSGSAGDDTLAGGTGNDMLGGDEGDDVCDGSTGTNTFTNCESETQSQEPDVEDLSDLDLDRMPDDVELRYGSNPAVMDTDGDGLRDDQEFIVVTDPTLTDSDANGITDPNDDADQDGRSNIAEFTDGTDPLVADSDTDGLNDGKEATAGTNPLLADTDADRSSDADEITLGTDPLIADGDKDGVLDGDEQVVRTVTFPESGASLQVTGAASSILGVALRSPADTDFAGIVGLRAPPVEVVTTEPIAGTLTLSFDTEGLAADAKLAVLHFDEATGMFDTPPNQYIDLTRGIATVTTDHFSPFVVVDINEFNAIWAKEITTPRPGGPGQRVDVVLALDSSGSMSDNDRSGLRKVAAKKFVDALLPGDRAAVVDFDSGYRVTQTLTADRSSVKNAIDQIDSNGGTDLSAAMQGGLGELNQHGATANKRVIVMLTDGDGGYQTRYTTQAVDSRTTVYTVGLGRGTNTALLDQIATATGGRFYLVDNASELEETFGTIGGDIGAPDTDGDGLADAAETGGMRTNLGTVVKTDPNQRDTDADGLSDGEEMGVIGSGHRYGAGTAFKFISDPTKVDTDGDGLWDAQEGETETGARIKDSDGDGLNDLTELEEGFDPLSFDGDSDSFFDDQEKARGTDPFVYDFDLLGNVHSAASGYAFGDAWDTDWARALNVNTNVASNGWYFVGQMVSGLLFVGDLRDMVYGVGTGQWLNAGFALLAFIPFVGDAARIVQSAIRFALKSTIAVFNAVPFIRLLPKAQAQQGLKLLAQLPGARLTRDIAAGGRALPVANFDIAKGTWKGNVVRSIGRDAAQKKALQGDLDELVRLRVNGAVITDVRVNQTQVAFGGKRVGINRPDLQYTMNGKRYYVEYDKPRCKNMTTSRRGDAHLQRILNNDPGIAIAQITLNLVGACE